MHPAEKRPPIINAPLPLTAFALLLIGLQIVWFVVPAEIKVQWIMSVGIFPERFWGWVAGTQLAEAAALPYANTVEAMTPFFLSFLIQGGWLGVIINAAMIVGIGKPVYSVILSIRSDDGRSAAIIFFLMLLLCQVVAGISYLLFNNPAGPVLVGPQGAIAGLLGALFLFEADEDGKILSRRFLAATSICAIAIALMTIIAPDLLGGQFAWEAFAGGYVAGALFARVLIWNALRKLDI